MGFQRKISMLNVMVKLPQFPSSKMPQIITFLVDLPPLHGMKAVSINKMIRLHLYSQLIIKKFINALIKVM